MTTPPDSNAAEMRQLIAKLDRTTCPLGSFAEWPECLQAAVTLALPSHAQIVIFAGEDYVAFYNDAYAPTIGRKHPQALGQPASVGWAELWDDLKPLLDKVRMTGETVSARDRPFQIDRHGFLEKVYFNISYSPIQDTTGRIHAVLCIVAETTERVNALRAEQRLSAIVSSTADAILGMDLDQRITAWNRGAEALYGYSETEVLGRPVTLLVPADRPDEENLIMAKIVEGVRVDTHETRRLRKDGSLVDVSLTVSPIHDQSGTIIGASKIARDITGRKQAEHLQRLLMGELNHRVKNVLSTVQAIAQQSFGSSDHARFNTFSGRLRALAHAQNLLMAQSWEGASLGAVANGVVNAFGRERFEVEGPEVHLPPRAVVALSLTLHELATNAAKYGALSNSEGRISIRWTSDFAAETFQLIWREAGGPPVVAPESGGFGSVLIKDALEAELNGAVELEYHSHGVICRVTGPIGAEWAQD